MNTIALRTWLDVLHVLDRQPPGSILRIRKALLVHPRRAGMKVSIGLPEGQRSDYRKVISQGRGLHVKEFHAHYEAHIDRVHPEVNVVEHLRRDAPGVYVGGGVALGATLGAALGRSEESAAVGAAIGGLLALMSAAPRRR
jgi:hypothetical protein